MFKRIIIIDLTIMFVAILIPAHQSLARSKPPAQSITSSTLQRHVYLPEAMVQKSAQQTNGEEMVSQAENGLDRSIGLLNVVATLMGVLVALITIVLLLATAFGLFEFRKWKSLRKEIEEYRVTAQKDVATTDKLLKDVEPIIKTVKEAEEYIDRFRNKAESISLTESPSENLKKKLDEYGKKIELLEAFGMPLKPEDYFNHGIDLYFKGKYELALEAFNKVIELKPDFANAWSNKGVILGKLGRYEEALQAINEAIKLKPDLAEAWDSKGIIFGKLGSYDEALQAYDKAIGLKPDLANAWYNRACIYTLKGNKQGALGDLSNAIKLDSKYKEKAKQDKDFEALWNDEDFKKIVE